MTRFSGRLAFPFARGYGDGTHPFVTFVVVSSFSLTRLERMSCPTLAGPTGDLVMRELKPLSRDAVDAALVKAERYRLLNEPGEAESICLDVLMIDATNQAAHITLLLALTDQFGEVPAAHQRARDTLRNLHSEYDRAYYAGIVAERRAKAQLARGGPGSSVGTYDWLAEAMRHFEQAEALRPPGNDDALLRWNACARFLARHPHLRSSADERPEIEMLE